MSVPVRDSNRSSNGGGGQESPRTVLVEDVQGYAAHEHGQ